MRADDEGWQGARRWADEQGALPAPEAVPPERTPEAPERALISERTYQNIVLGGLLLLAAFCAGMGIYAWNHP